MEDLDKRPTNQYLCKAHWNTATSQIGRQVSGSVEKKVFIQVWRQDTFTPLIELVSSQASEEVGS